MSLAWITKRTLEKSRRICFNFIWSRVQDQRTPPWEKWDILACPKALGGLGLKNIFDQIDTSKPWDFFNGASQNNNQSCRGGVVLFL